MTPLLKRLAHYSDVNTTCLDQIESLPHRIESRDPGDEIVTEGDRIDYVFFIESGWAIRYRLIDDGRRQILNFMLPGDCFDLMSVTNAASDHNVAAATSVTIRRIKSEDFLRVIAGNAALAASFWWVAIHEESILREQIVRNGRRNARERVGHMILELNRRISMSTGMPSDEVEIPVRQSLLADALGLSPVHVSRTISVLKRAGLISQTPSGFKILDRAFLSKISDFDPRYLRTQKLNLYPA